MAFSGGAQAPAPFSRVALAHQLAKGKLRCVSLPKSEQRVWGEARDLGLRKRAKCPLGSVFFGRAGEKEDRKRSLVELIGQLLELGKRRRGRTSFP
jgi:hypothetical protein